MSAFQIRAITAEQQAIVGALLKQYWGSTRVVTRGRLVQVDTLPGFVAWREEEPIGVITYERIGSACEISVLLSLVQGLGIGTALIAAVKEVAQQAGCCRLWLITTNDNTPALRFYQKRGFHIAAVHINALEHSRQLKPEIPLLGLDDIPLRDEIELEQQLHQPVIGCREGSE